LCRLAGDEGGKGDKIQSWGILRWEPPGRKSDRHWNGEGGKNGNTPRGGEGSNQDTPGFFHKEMRKRAGFQNCLKRKTGISPAVEKRGKTGEPLESKMEKSWRSAEEGPSKKIPRKTPKEKKGGGKGRAFTSEGGAGEKSNHYRNYEGLGKSFQMARLGGPPALNPKQKKNTARGSKKESKNVRKPFYGKQGIKKIRQCEKKGQDIEDTEKRKRKTGPFLLGFSFWGNPKEGKSGVSKFFNRVGRNVRPNYGRGGRQFTKKKNRVHKNKREGREKGG